MHTKISLMLFIFCLFFLNGFSQNTEKSTHPLMDKYYPPKPKTEPVPVIAPTANARPVINPVAQTKNETTKIDTSANIKGVNPPVQIAETPVIVEAKPATVVDSTAINKPQAMVPVAVQKPVQSNPETPYNPNRLGSSSPLYNTWEKNNNGAGSVTTGSK